LASYGINTVRVSIGYWLPGFDRTGGSDWAVFAPGALKYVDILVKNWAVKYNVAVLV
jgi:glucan 1,3-beta-glucosidase